MSDKPHINIIKAAVEPCELCGKKEELRPYGPGGKWVCYDCAMKDEAEAIRQFDKFINQPGINIIDTRL